VLYYGEEIGMTNRALETSPSFATWSPSGCTPMPRPSWECPRWKPWLMPQTPPATGAGLRCSGNRPPMGASARRKAHPAARWDQPHRRDHGRRSVRRQGLAAELLPPDARPAPEHSGPPGGRLPPAGDRLARLPGLPALRPGQRQSVLVALNFSPKLRRIELGLPQITGKLLLSTERARPRDIRLSDLVLGPFEVMIVDLAPASE
jgi:hypothetical protein